MVFPVIGDSRPGPRFGKRGRMWSCRPDASGKGVHTGVDIFASSGTPVVAARPGTVRYVSFGSALGDHQLAVLVEDGTLDFYAHMRKRTAANGSQVTAGQQIGEVGAEGNTGDPPVPHLHFERHRNQGLHWNCKVHVDPTASLEWQPLADLAMGFLSTATLPGTPETPIPTEEDELMAVTVKHPTTGQEVPIQDALWSMWTYILEQRDDPDQTAHKVWEEVVTRDGKQVSVKQELADDKTLAIANANAIMELKAKVDALSATVANLATMMQAPHPTG